MHQKFLVKSAQLMLLFGAKVAKYDGAYRWPVATKEGNF